MLRQILPEQAVRMVERERELLTAIRALAERFEPDSANVRRIGDLLDHLDDMFLLVVVGEVKAGKSAFINALLHADVCPEGPTPLTDRVFVLAHGDRDEQIEASETLVRRTLPLDVLRNMNVVDTPGTNSPLRRHQEITEGFLPRADIVFFVTSIDCPLTHTELDLLGSIRRRWRKEVALVLAKVDLHPEGDRGVVLRYLEQSFREHLSFLPSIFATSAHAARRAQKEGDDEALEASGMPAVERFIVEHLSQERRIQLKLQSPLGAARDVLDEIERDATARRSVLEEDFAGWGALREQVTFSATSIPERAERQLTPIYVAFENLEARGRNFLRDAFRLRRLRDVADAGRFRERFEREVVRNASSEVEARVEDATRWLGEETQALWERSLAYFEGRVAISKYRDEILAGTGPRFRETRAGTLKAIASDARTALSDWNVDAECKRVRDLASKGFARLIGTEVAAAGIGTALAATLLPSVLGGVGIALAVLVAVGGFSLLPARRQKAIESFERGVRSSRDAVLSAVRMAIAAEAARASSAVLDAFSPFRDFYENRRRALEAVVAETATLRDRVEEIRSDLG